MDYSRSSLLSMQPYFCHGKSVEELGQSWMCTTVELESLKMQAQEEIRRRDEQLNHVKELLYMAMKERDEALQKCRTLQFERLILQEEHQKQQQQQIKEVKNATPADPLFGLSSIEDEPIRNKNTNYMTSSDGDDHSIVSSPAIDPISTTIQTQTPIFHQQPNLTQISLKLQSFHEEVMERLLPDTKFNHPLPEKGKLLEAVMNAGPLLQTLLLAGPLPQWKHPPPPLESFEIPPVTITINNNRVMSRKRGLTGSTHCLDSSTDHQSHKLQKQNTTLIHQ